MILFNINSSQNESWRESIQANGCLLRFDAAVHTILQVSANLYDILGLSVASTLTSSPRDILGIKLQSRIQQTLAYQSRLSAALIINRQVLGSYQRFYVMAYRSQDSVVVEFEPLSRSGEQRLMPIVNEWLSRLAQIQTPEQLQQKLVQSVQAVTGYDRVMLCQFNENWHRTVIAEACRNPERSLLNFRFPASDMPEKIRQRYTVNPIRSITDAHAKMVPLIPASTELKLSNLDLSLGMLKSISPAHRQYLNEIKVESALSIAIFGEQRLWGFLTCHGFSASEISPAERDAAYNLVQMATQRLFLLQSRQQVRFQDQVLLSRERLSAERDNIIHPLQLLDKHGKEWLELFNCSGISLLYEGQVRCSGETLDNYELDIVGKWLSNQEIFHCWVCDQLADSPINEMVDLRNRAGLLAVPLPIEQAQSGWLLLFRQARPAIVSWVGKKQVIETIARHPLQYIEERGYEIWVENLTDAAEPWTPNEQNAAQDLAEDLAVAITLHQINRLNTQLQRANQQLREIAHTDTLTQVWNRYRMELAIEAELAAVARYQHACSVLLFDVDHFKFINDTFGHEVGDQVLTRLAEEVQSKLRSSDYFGRWGGEEFIVLASHSVLEDALGLAERLRKHIESVNFTAIGNITVSIGVAQAVAGTENRKQLLERADQAMYHAKQSGRNRVEAAELIV